MALNQIYKLIDPRDNIPMYVGLTTDHLICRLCNHIATNKSHLKKNPNSKIHKWLFELILLDKMPIIKCIKKLTPQQNPNEEERKWIRIYKQKNPNLLNVSNGGLGISLLGENHPSAKLTDEQVLEIVRLYREKQYNQYQLAEMFNISRSHISKLTLGTRWNPKYAKNKRSQNYEKKKKG